MHKLRSFSVAKLAEVFSRLSSRQKNTGGRPSAPLGSRILTDPDDIFKHNMWDHVQWTEQDKENARQKAEENSCIQIPIDEQGKFDTEACQYWDKFYKLHQDKFFKDRKWLFLEFPELLPSSAKSQATNWCLGDQHVSDPQPAESSTDTETRHRQHNGPTHHRRNTDTSNNQGRVGHGAAPEKHEAAFQTATFPGQHASFRILEVGCGVGNSVFPIINSINVCEGHQLPGSKHGPKLLPSNAFLLKRFEGSVETADILQQMWELGAFKWGRVYRVYELGPYERRSHVVFTTSQTDAFLYCCDFSTCAIQLVKDHPDYDDSVCHAFVHDICEKIASFPFPPQSLDVILAVFVLSSIHPRRMQGIVNRLSTYLKHGGIFLFRDYGRYDLSQLRFKKGRCLSENFYTRGDGTCVYFFTKEEVHDLFSNAGLEEIQNLEDRRLQVNRGKKVAMHRVWMQSKYRKLYPPPPS